MKEPKDYIIFPLDLPTYDRAISYVETLDGHVGLFKVGLELFIAQGPEIFKAIRNFTDRKSTRLNSSHTDISRMPSSA